MGSSPILRLTTLTDNKSLGGNPSDVELPAVALNNLFDDVLPDEAAAGDIEYRAIDVFNNGDAAAVVISMYCSGTSNANTDILLALEASPLNSVTAIPDEQTAPPVAGSFQVYTTDSRLTLPDIPVGEYARVWVSRVVTAGAENQAGDGVQFSVEYA